MHSEGRRFLPPPCISLVDVLAAFSAQRRQSALHPSLSRVTSTEIVAITLSATAQLVRAKAVQYDRDRCCPRAGSRGGLVLGDLTLKQAYTLHVARTEPSAEVKDLWRTAQVGPSADRLAPRDRTAAELSTN